MRQESPHPARWWTAVPDDAGARFRCDLCPRACHLRPGQRGFCFVRAATDDGVVLTTWGRSSGFCIDPIEKKPLYHHLPGTPVLSFGTAGCNLGCRFCQNWDISKAREMDRLQSRATPEAIARVAAETGCRSVAFTYNDPIIWAEYAIDTAQACHEMGVATVAVTAAYATPEAWAAFVAHMDAANIDLKAFTEDFYRRWCLGHLEPVRECIAYAVRETNCWVELTTLVIEGLNDDDAEIDRMTSWIVDALGPDVPLHLSAFHPDFKMLDRPPTRLETLRRARAIALRNGLRHVYVGNVHDPEADSTWCPNCRACVVERDWYALGTYRIRNGRCAACGTPIAGRFDDDAGRWGRRRRPVVVR